VAIANGALEVFDAIEHGNISFEARPLDHAVQGTLPSHR